MKKQIKIIGCGVSGLTTGIELLEAGYQVEIITEKLPNQTTSAIAAAIWFPHKVGGNQETVSQWCYITYNKFKALCQNPNSGVSMVKLTQLIKAEAEAWWKNALPEQAIRKADKSELPNGFELGYILDVPLIETPIYLEFLLNQFKVLGGTITLNKVKKINTLFANSFVIINCSGLGARKLVKDKSLIPVQGQIIKVASQKNIKYIAADFPFDDAKKGEIAYIIPRKDGLILGGTAYEGKKGTVPSASISKRIIKRCKRIEPNLTAVKIITEKVGLRPVRPEIRLEKEGKVIHNYGHGGGGFTVSWGCAKEVRDMIDRMKYLQEENKMELFNVFSSRHLHYMNRNWQYFGAILLVNAIIIGSSGKSNDHTDLAQFIAYSAMLIIGIFYHLINWTNMRVDNNMAKMNSLNLVSTQLSDWFFEEIIYWIKFAIVILVIPHIYYIYKITAYDLKIIYFIIILCVLAISISELIVYSFKKKNKK